MTSDDNNDNDNNNNNNNDTTTTNNNNIHQIIHGSFLVRRQRGHPGVALPLVISNSANQQECN